MKTDKKIPSDKSCQKEGCNCNANYIWGALVVILIVMYIATTIK
jgi:hypothetical protein